MKRIAMINYDMSTVGGAQQVLYNQVMALKNKYKFYVISLIQKNDTWAYQFPDDVELYSVFTDAPRLRDIIKKGKTPLINYFNERSIDLVLFIGNYSGYCSSLMLKKYHCKKIFCDHNSVIGEWKEWETRIMRFIAYHMSDRTIVLTQKNALAYSKKFMLKKKIGVIYNWIDGKILNSSAEYEPTSRKILTIGRFTRQKGYDLLIKVAQELYKLDKNWEWDIYGTGPLFSDVQNDLEQCGLSEKIHLKGVSNHIEDCYGGHALYVMTSYWEGLPLVLLEAKANHIPTISFDIETGPSDIITNCEDGYLIPPFDVKKMAAQITLLLNDTAKRIEMSDKCYLNINKFSKEKITKQWIQLFEELLNN